MTNLSHYKEAVSSVLDDMEHQIWAERYKYDHKIESIRARLTSALSEAVLDRDEIQEILEGLDT
ncbi:MAG: hypothetical protein [Caudoviricetes sp.]|nr:MAG: hypothetical protein [Caudoviricetes sp.]